MDENKIIGALSALAQNSRLDAFRLLSYFEPEGMPAGEIARQLEVPQNTMSAHLKILEQSGLIRSERQGRSILYRVEMGYFHQLIYALQKDCCGGQADKCVPNISKGPAQCV